MRKVDQLRGTVAILGLGYVGLPLALTASRNAWKVIGIDNDSNKVISLNKYLSYIEDISDEEIKESISKGTLLVTQEVSQIAVAQVVVICVPTPINENKPDLTHLENAIDDIAPYLKDGTLVVSESSSFPGTLREVVKGRIEEKEPKKKLYFAHAPERVDPGNGKWKTSNTPRLVSGIGSKAQELALNFYGSICDEVVAVDKPEIAEAAKMFENTFRQVNLALVNQFARYCHHVGLDASQVLDAAATKPYGFMRFFHGAGVGGHCIPVDPYYLVHHAEREGFQLSLVAMSLQINFEQTEYVVSRIQELLKGSLQKKKILVIGIAYKPNTSDIRESPGLRILQQLRAQGSYTFWFDPLVDSSQAPFVAEPDGDWDMAVVAMWHNNVNYSHIIEKIPLLLDCTGQLREGNNVYKL